MSARAVHPRGRLGPNYSFVSRVQRFELANGQVAKKWEFKTIRSSGNVLQCGIKQTFAITFALSCGFEKAFSQGALEHCGLLLRPKTGPSVVQSFLQDGNGFRIKMHWLFAHELPPILVS
jgi:hypothetical protein